VVLLLFTLKITTSSQLRINSLLDSNSSLQFHISVGALNFSISNNKLKFTICGFSSCVLDIFLTDAKKFSPFSMTYYCYNCEKIFRSSEAVNSHCDALGHRRASICTECNQLFCNKQALEQHEKVIHEHWGNTCNEVFRNEAALTQHDAV